jgi:hypothetical protein
MDEEQMSSSNDHDVTVLGGGATRESAGYDVIVLGAGPVEQALGWRDFVVSDYDDSTQQRCSPS